MGNQLTNATPASAVGALVAELLEDREDVKDAFEYMKWSGEHLLTMDSSPAHLNELINGLASAVKPPLNFLQKQRLLSEYSTARRRVEPPSDTAAVVVPVLVPAPATAAQPILKADAKKKNKFKDRLRAAQWTDAAAAAIIKEDCDAHDAGTKTPHGTTNIVVVAYKTCDYLDHLRHLGVDKSLLDDLSISAARLMEIKRGWSEWRKTKEVKEEKEDDVGGGRGRGKRALESVQGDGAKTAKAGKSARTDEGGGPFCQDFGLMAAPAAGPRASSSVGVRGRIERDGHRNCTLDCRAARRKTGDEPAGKNHTSAQQQVVLRVGAEERHLSSRVYLCCPSRRLAPPVMSCAPGASMLDAARRTCQDDVLQALKDHVEQCWRCKRAFQKDVIEPISFTCSCVMALCNQCARNELGKSEVTYKSKNSEDPFPFIVCPKCPPEDDSGGRSMVSNSDCELAKVASVERELLQELVKLLGLRMPSHETNAGPKAINTRMTAYEDLFKRLECDERLEREGRSPWQLKGLVAAWKAHAEESLFSHPVCTLLLARCMVLIKQKQREKEQQQQGSHKAPNFVIPINNLDTDLPFGPLELINFMPDRLILNVSRTLQGQMSTRTGEAQLRTMGFECNIGNMSEVKHMSSDVCLTCYEAFPLSPPCKFSCPCFSIIICVKCQLDRLAADMTPRSFVEHAGGDKGFTSKWNDATLPCCLCKEDRYSEEYHQWVKVHLRNPKLPVILKGNITRASEELDSILKVAEYEKGKAVQRSHSRTKEDPKKLFENLIKYIKRYEKEDGVDFRFSLKDEDLSLVGHAASYNKNDATIDADRDLDYFKMTVARMQIAREMPGGAKGLQTITDNKYAISALPLGPLLTLSPSVNRIQCLLVLFTTATPWACEWLCDPGWEQLLPSFSTSRRQLLQALPPAHASDADPLASAMVIEAAPEPPVPELPYICDEDWPAMLPESHINSYEAFEAEHQERRVTVRRSSIDIHEEEASCIFRRLSRWQVLDTFPYEHAPLHHLVNGGGWVRGTLRGRSEDGLHDVGVEIKVFFTEWRISFGQHMQSCVYDSSMRGIILKSERSVDGKDVWYILSDTKESGPEKPYDKKHEVVRDIQNATLRLFDAVKDVSSSGLGTR